MKFDWSGKRILIVEDNVSNFKYFEAILRMTQANFEWVQNGQLAVEFCKKEDYHLILMDIQLPELDGYEATNAIRLFNKEIPIIAVTAFVNEKERLNSLKAGCSHYIGKPFKASLFLPILDSFLNPAKSENPA
jgi:CheY-like chemotaxis protein